MSLDTTVYVGLYLVCEMSERPSEKTLRVCSKNPKHANRFPVDDAKFCWKCGSKIIESTVSEIQHCSYSDVLYEKTEEELTSDERRVLELFYHMNQESIGCEIEGCEIVLPNHTRQFVADNEGVHDMDKESFQYMSADIDPKKLDLLQTVMKYKSIDVRYGVLVSVC